MAKLWMLCICLVRLLLFGVFFLVYYFQRWLVLRALHSITVVYPMYLCCFYCRPTSLSLLFSYVPFAFLCSLLLEKFAVMPNPCVVKGKRIHSPQTRLRWHRRLANLLRAFKHHHHLSNTTALSSSQH
jgi:hypothetical protein